MTLAWLAHPVSVTALVVLVINDHVLKVVAPGFLTGKLSDVAGLVLAAPLLSFGLSLVFPRRPARSVAIAALVAVGVGFGFVKATAWGADAASAVWSLARPSVIRADPTDLLALPALLLAWWAYRSSRRHRLAPRAVRVARTAVLLPLAALAVAGTSAARYPEAWRVLLHDRALIVITSEEYDSSASGGDRLNGVATTDGVSWQDLTDEQRAYVNALPKPLRPTFQACDSGPERMCYRVDGERLAVQQSLDGGANWRVAWSVSEGRRLFLARGIPGNSSGTPDYVTSRSVGVLPVPGGHVVVVANGRDGILTRDTAGEWRRIGFPTAASAEFGAGYPSRPPTLTQRGTRITHEYLMVIILLGLALLLAALPGPRRRALYGPPRPGLYGPPRPGLYGPPRSPPYGPRPSTLDRPGGRWLAWLSVPIYLVAALPLIPFIEMFRFPELISVIGPLDPAVIGLLDPVVVVCGAYVAGFAVALVGLLGIAFWRIAILLVATDATVAVAMRPMIGWSAGHPDAYSAAIGQTARLGALGALLVVAVGLGCGLLESRLVRYRGRLTP